MTDVPSTLPSSALTETLTLNRNPRPTLASVVLLIYRVSRLSTIHKCHRSCPEIRTELLLRWPTVALFILLTVIQAVLMMTLIWRCWTLQQCRRCTIARCCSVLNFC